jgi:hypothetical protein
LAKLLVVRTHHFVTGAGTLPEKTSRNAIMQNGEQT